MTRRNIQGIQGVPFWSVRCKFFQHISRDAVPSQETESAESISRRRETTDSYSVYIYIHIYIAYVPVCTYKMCYICYYHHYYGYPYLTMAILMIMHVSIHSKLCAICLNHLKSSDLGMKPPYYIGMYVLYIYIIHFSPTPRPAANARRLLLKISSKISTG